MESVVQFGFEIIPRGRFLTSCGLTSGTTNGTSATYTPPTFTLAGTFNYAVLVTQSVSGCASTYSTNATVSVVLDPSVSAPTGASYCQNASASILTATGSTLEWFTVPVGGSPTGAPTPATGIPGTTSYYVQQTVGGCVSPRAQIDVIINPFPTFGGAASATPASCGASDGSVTGLTVNGTRIKLISSILLHDYAANLM
jgi:oligosaccharide reducing-end xylanase